MTLHRAGAPRRRRYGRLPAPYECGNDTRAKSRTVRVCTGVCGVPAFGAASDGCGVSCVTARRAQACWWPVRPTLRSDSLNCSTGMLRPARLRVVLAGTAKISISGESVERACRKKRHGHPRVQRFRRSARQWRYGTSRPMEFSTGPRMFGDGLIAMTEDAESADGAGRATQSGQSGVEGAITCSGVGSDWRVAPLRERVLTRPLESGAMTPASVRAAAREHRERRLREDRKVEPDRPVLEVVEVEPDEIVEA